MWKISSIFFLEVQFNANFGLGTALGDPAPNFLRLGVKCQVHKSKFVS